MDPKVLQDWVVPLTGIVTCLSIALGIWLALREYRLKLAAERRLSHSSQVEAEIQLLKLFTEIMTIAHARGGYAVSEKAVEFLLKDKTLEQLTQGGQSLRDILSNGALVAFPVGSAAQDAAIAAIGTLGGRHAMLRDVALQALESLAEFKPAVAAKYLARLAENPSATVSN